MATTYTEKTIKDIPDDELAILAVDVISEKFEHTYFEDDSEDNSNEFQYIHAYWNCSACVIEDEVKRRRYAEESKLVGNIPDSVNGFKSITAKDVKIGMYASMILRPGTTKYPSDWMEAITVSPVNDKVFIVWKLSNTDSSGFVIQAEYNLDDNVEVGYNTSLHK